MSQEAHTVMGAQDPGLGEFVVRLESLMEAGQTGILRERGGGSRRLLPCVSHQDD